MSRKFSTEPPSQSERRSTVPSRRSASIRGKIPSSRKKKKVATVPRVAMTLKKCGYYTKSRGHVPIFKGSRRLQVASRFGRGPFVSCKKNILASHVSVRMTTRTYTLSCVSKKKRKSPPPPPPHKNKRFWQTILNIRFVVFLRVPPPKKIKSSYLVSLQPT